jgi:hypothetical protein
LSVDVGSLSGELLSLACEGGVQRVQLSLLAGVVVVCGGDSVVGIGDGGVLGTDEILEFGHSCMSRVGEGSFVAFEDGDLVLEDVNFLLKVDLVVLESDDLDVWGWNLGCLAIGAVIVVYAIVLDFGDRVGGVDGSIALLVLVELVGRVIICFASVVILDLDNGSSCGRSLHGSVVCLRGDVRWDPRQCRCSSLPCWRLASALP